MEEDKKVHLCNNCRNTYPECTGEITFGDGVGDDNVIDCSGYYPVEEKEWTK